MKIEITTSFPYLKSDLNKVMEAIEELSKKYPHLIDENKVEIFVKC